MQHRRPRRRDRIIPLRPQARAAQRPEDFLRLAWVLLLVALAVTALVLAG